MFSKSFGYALRGILYIAHLHGQQHKVQVDEIARQLALPPHFMSKILKNLVKHNILSSSKGSNGGFRLNEHTLNTPLLRIVEVTEGLGIITNCALRMQECNNQNPCPLHYKVEVIKQTLRQQLAKTIIQDLMDIDNPDYIPSLMNNNSPLLKHLS